MKRGEVWLAALDPVQGSEQAGNRPVLVVQDDALNAFLRTIVVAPFTSNLNWARYPFCVLVPGGEGGLKNDSVLLGHQTRVLDKTRLIQHWGELNEATLLQVERALQVMLGM